MTNVASLSKKLKDLIRKYEHSSFQAHWSYLANMHYRNKSNDTPKLLSPIRQLMYIISLYHSTGFEGTEHFEAFGKEYDEIISLLNEIEKLYIINPKDLTDEQRDEATLKKLFISNNTFLNYYLNAPLSFTEQDIERIRRTFVHFESLIVDECGLTLEDFLTFYIVVSNLEMQQYSSYYDHTPDERKLIFKARDRPNDLTDQETARLFEITQRGVRRLAIPISKLKSLMPADKVDVLLSIFTLMREEDDKYLYYTDPCPYLTRPVLLMDPEHIVFIYSKQLINAIYDFLFEVCSAIDTTGRRVLSQRENYLEYKTEEIFKDFFGKNAKIYTNYNISGSEKDLLVTTPNYAFIIECKANKYRIPFRDPIKAYDRINDDFKRSIGKAYQQAKEVENHFATGKSINIKDEKGRVMDILHSKKFYEVFSIIVTQERFGQIQCNLGELLEIGPEDNYPWAVALDDLETFLITLARKKNHIQEFVSYLKAREQLHGRLYCFDELELCANFIMQRKTFLEQCNHTCPLLCGTDVNKFFDDLYSVGFGFKDELNLDEKTQRKNPVASALVKALKLGNPARLK